MTEVYPLQWPAGWPRTPAHKREDSRHRFSRMNVGGRAGREPWSFVAARDALYDELGRLARGAIVMSTNFPPSRHGVPTEGRRRPDDQGVAVYFQLAGKPTVMACDMHERAEENMRSLTLAIEAMRALERHGGGTMMNRAFEGFAQIEAPGAKHWSSILGVPATATADEIQTAFRKLAPSRHPDAGGSEAMMAELNVARDAGLKATAGR